MNAGSHVRFRAGIAGATPAYGSSRPTASSSLPSNTPARMEPLLSEELVPNCAVANVDELWTHARRNATKRLSTVLLWHVIYIALFNAVASGTTPEDLADTVPAWFFVFWFITRM